MVLMNLLYIGGACAIFAFACGANILFGICYNVKILQQDFSRDKLLGNLQKLGIFLAGLILLTICITTIPVIVKMCYSESPDVVLTAISIISIIGIFINAIIKYIAQAIQKLTNILNGKSIDNTADTSAIINSLAAGKKIESINIPESIPDNVQEAPTPEQENQYTGIVQ